MSADPIPALMLAHACISCGAGIGQPCRPPAGYIDLIPADMIGDVMATGWTCAGRYQAAIATRN